MDSEVNEEQLEIRPGELACPPKQNQSLFSNKFNAMTLFAYRGDGEQDNFASAFSNSRFNGGNSRIDQHFQPKASYKGSSSNEKSNEDNQRQYVGGLPGQSIWMVPFQQAHCMQQQVSEPASAAQALQVASSDSVSSCSHVTGGGDQKVIDLDRQFARISNTSVRSAKSAKSDSSNGSSLEKEIFGSIPNNFDQNVNTQEQIEPE